MANTDCPETLRAFILQHPDLSDDEQELLYAHADTWMANCATLIKLSAAFDQREAEQKAKIAQLETELAGMELMNAEGEAFGETIVRENEQLKEGIAAWEAKAGLFVDQGEELRQEKFRHCVTKKLLANEQAILNKRYEQTEQLKTERDALVIERDKLLDLSMELDEHPEDYDGPCMCALCRSYGD